MERAYNYKFAVAQRGMGSICGVEIHPQSGITIKNRHEELEKFVRVGTLVCNEIFLNDTPPPATPVPDHKDAAAAAKVEEKSKAK